MIHVPVSDTMAAVPAGDVVTPVLRDGIVFIRSSTEVCSGFDLTLERSGAVLYRENRITKITTSWAMSALAEQTRNRMLRRCGFCILKLKPNSFSLRAPRIPKMQKAHPRASVETHGCARLSLNRSYCSNTARCPSEDSPLTVLFFVFHRLFNFTVHLDVYNVATSRYNSNMNIT